MKTIWFLILCVNIQLAAQEKLHTVVLNVSEPLHEIPFYCSEVIDKRVNPSRIGKVFKGWDKKRAIAQLEGELEFTMKKILGEILLSEKGKIGLVFIFHELHIDEKINMPLEQSLCRIEVEFARRKAGQLYSLGIFDQQLIGSGEDATFLHGRGIILALKRCIKAFSETDFINRNGILIKEGEPKYKFDFKSIPPKGVYLSFGQMARGIPSVTADFKMKTQKPSAKIVKYQCSINEPLSKYVKYISDGKDVFIYSGKQSRGIKEFVKFKHYGKYMYFEDKISDPDVIAFFGIIGALVSNKKRALILNTEKNELKILDGYYLHEITKGKYPEILRTYKKSRRKLADLEMAIVELNQAYMLEEE